MDCLTDVIFVLDGYGIKISYYFELMKAFVSKLVGKMNIDSGETRMGLVVYSSEVVTSFTLDFYSNVTLIQSAIRQLSGINPGTTNTAAALAYVRESMLTPANGDRSNVSNVIVLFMDGNSDNRTATRVSGMLSLLQESVDNSETVSTSSSSSSSSSSSNVYSASITNES